MHAFEPWSPPHLVVLVLTFGVPSLAVICSRRDPTGRVERNIRVGYAVVLVGQLIAGLFLVGIPAARTWADVMPLQLCHWALFACVAACLTRSRFACDIAYYWGLAGTLQGLITPGLSQGFPSAEFFVFFVGHGGIVGAVLFLVFGAGYRPQRSSWIRAFIAILAYAAIVGGFDGLFDQNYGYLCAKPPVPTLFDVLGPWPWYLANAALLAAALFLLLYVPWGLIAWLRGSGGEDDSEQD